jgi:hypothetical protein
MKTLQTKKPSQGENSERKRTPDPENPRRIHKLPEDNGRTASPKAHSPRPKELQRNDKTEEIRLVIRRIMKKQPSNSSASSHH